VISQKYKLFQKYKLEICKNPEKYENFNTVNKYINNKNLLKHLNQIGIIEMKEIIHIIQETIISNKEFNELFNTDLNNTVYKFLKKNICKPNQTTIKAFILILRLILDSRNYYYDEELEGYEVVVDETKFRKRTDYGIHMSKLH
jgi:DNA-binding ferritin-like protein (Dps family)